jgi:hypothetical protein
MGHILYTRVVVAVHWGFGNHLAVIPFIVINIVRSVAGHHLSTQRYFPPYSSSLRSSLLVQQTQMGTHVSFAYLGGLFQSVTGGPARTNIAHQNESEKKMWTEYMKEAEKYDGQAAEDWREDSTGILVFVRLNLLFWLFIAMTI